MYQCLQCSREFAERQPANRCPHCRGNMFHVEHDSATERAERFAREMAIESVDIPTYRGRPSNRVMAERRALLEGAV